MPLNGYLKEKNYPVDIVHSKEFHNSKEIHRRITPFTRFNQENKKTLVTPDRLTQVTHAKTDQIQSKFLKK